MHKNLKYNCLIFLIYPLAGVAVSLRNYKAPWAKNILWAFIVFYGFTFVIGKESEGSDINRYVDEYVSLYGKPMTFSDAITYYETGYELDIMRPMLAVLVSRVSNSPIALITVYAIIFGFFYSRNLFYLFAQLQGRLSKWTWLWLIVFSLIVPIWNINGFRFWTAAHIFIFGLLPYLFEGKKKQLWFCVLPVLFHFSFVVPLISLISYFFIPNRLGILILIFLGTVIYNEIDVQWLANYIDSTGNELLVERTEGYLDEEIVDEFRSGQSGTVTKVWYAVWYSKGLNYAILFSIIGIYWLHRTRQVLTKPLLHTFAFALWFYSFANILSTIPSGGRFLSLAHMVSIFVLVILYQNHYRKYFSGIIFPIFSPAIVLYIIVSIRMGFYSFSATTVLGNPITAIIGFGENVALNNFIK